MWKRIVWEKKHKECEEQDENIMSTCKTCC